MCIITRRYARWGTTYEILKMFHTSLPPRGNHLVFGKTVYPFSTKKHPWAELIRVLFLFCVCTLSHTRRMILIFIIPSFAHCHPAHPTFQLPCRVRGRFRLIYAKICTPNYLLECPASDWLSVLFDAPSASFGTPHKTRDWRPFPALHGLDKQGSDLWVRLG